MAALQKGVRPGQPQQRVETADGQQGRQPVEMRDDLVGHLAGLDPARPANQKGAPHSAFIDRSLAAFHAAIPAPAIWAIVAEINDDGVFTYVLSLCYFS
mgnify:CR=1 FL=1